MREFWQRRVAQVVAQRPKARTFSAFNLNVDVIARVTPQAIQRLIGSAPELDWQKVAEIDADALRGVRTREEFVAVLRHGFRTGKSILLVCETEELVPWWREVFLERAESRGGRGGILRSAQHT